MKRKWIAAAALLAVLLPAGCGGAEKTAPAKEPEKTAEVTPLAEDKPTAAEVGGTEEETAVPSEAVQEKNEGLQDGSYLAAFDTDSSMFHVNEAWEGKGVLTISGGQMSIHLVMPSKNVVNLFPGLAEDAAKEGAVLLEPVTEEVTYSDGMVEEVYAFDLPVPVLGEEFDCALIGTKGKWYDHKVKVSDPKPYDPQGSGAEAEVFEIEAWVEGGTGRASISTPAKITISGGETVITLEWSSPYYDYMIVDGIKYLPVNTDGNSVFEIPLKSIEDISITADTTAMSKPHEIEYILHLDPATMK